MGGDFQRHPKTGAPYVTHPTDTTKNGRPKRVMYGRPSSFGGVLDNPYNLIKWKERQLLLGYSLIDRDLMPVIDPKDRDALDQLASHCHHLAGSSLAADRGSFIHLLCEVVDRAAVTEAAA
jgi:hypothetical protein